MYSFARNAYENLCFGMLSDMAGEPDILFLVRNVCGGADQNAVWNA